MERITKLVLLVSCVATLVCQWEVIQGLAGNNDYAETFCAGEIVFSIGIVLMTRGMYLNRLRSIDREHISGIGMVEHHES